MKELHDEHAIYQNPLCMRYASRQMQTTFSDNHKFTTWRRLWLALAEAERELGLNISTEQIAELKANLDNINYEDVAAKEKELRHDVMAHVHSYGAQCPKAKKIIHLGATSCFVTDNCDLLIFREALQLIRVQLVNLIKVLGEMVEKYKALPMLGFTHLQAAQPVTLGKRASLWLWDILQDLDNLDYICAKLRFRGCKGTTGTQASFLELFAGSAEKVYQLDSLVAQKMGFASVYPVCSQTYSRKVDFQIVQVLSGIAQSAHKFANDIRLLQHMKIVDEPFESSQIGSSAMAYKRNPMRSERLTALARHLISTLANPALTAAEQWLERTLDDSANRRISMPEAFLACDAILILYHNVVTGLNVYPQMAARQIRQELPFMLTEQILMQAVQKGGDRQLLHEKIRVLSLECAQSLKDTGKETALLEKIQADKDFALSATELENLLQENILTGLAEQQCENLLRDYVYPLLQREELSETTYLITV